MIYTIEDFKRREFEMNEGNKITNKIKHDVRGRVFKHDFLDDEDKVDVVGDIENCDGVYYCFIRDPNKKEINNVSIGDVPEIEIGDVVMWLMFISPQDEVKVGYAKVVNGLELGAKHATIAQYIYEKWGDGCVFVASGEIKKINSIRYKFNYQSGTFMLPRKQVETYEFQEFDDEEQERLNKEYVKFSISLTNDTAFVKSELQRLNPFLLFEFHDVPFKVMRKMPFGALKGQLNDPNDYPHILPSNVSKMCLNHFEFASSVLSDFKNLDEVVGTCVNVNRYATLTSVSTSGITKKDMDNYVKRTKNNDTMKRISNKKFSVIYPQGNDLEIAKSIYDELGVVKYGQQVGGRPCSARDDILNLTGKEFDIWYKNIPKRLVVGEHLATSNNIIYRGVFGGKDIVLKIATAFVVNGYRGVSGLGNYEISLYGKEIETFVIPGVYAVAAVLPYLGVTIDKLSLEFRKENYKKFRRDYFSKFKKTTYTGKKSKYGDDKNYYNDMKPENTTWDGNEFHLIDPDTSAYTDRWYGPSTLGKLERQLFGILILYYWFKTGEIVFKDDDSDEAKIKWVKELPSGSKMKELCSVLFSTELSLKDKLNAVGEFSDI